MDVKAAIDNGDSAALRRLLSEDSSRANELIRWGKCLTHPLHYISDMLFGGTLKKGKELPLVEALIQNGADLNFNKSGKSETPLIGAASLGAEDVGLRFLDAGARPELRGGCSAKRHFIGLRCSVRIVSRLR
jgi:hypothetical protein